MFKRLKDCSLFQQLIVPMIIVGVVSLFVTIYSARMLERSVADLGEAAKVGDNKLRSLEEIDKSLAYYRALTMRHLLSENSASMRDIEGQLKRSEMEIMYLHALVTPHANSGVHQTQSPDDRLGQLLTLYFDKIHQSMKQSADFEKEHAFILWTHSENDFMSDIRQTIQAKIRNEFTGIHSSRDSLMSVASRNLDMTILFGIGSASLLLLIAFVVTRRITHRLSRLLSWSQQVSAGDLMARLDADSRDEVGRLTEAMQEMAYNIHQKNQELAEAKHEAEETTDKLRIYANAFANSGEAIIITDKDNNIINANDAFTQQTGYSLQEVYGKNPRILSSGTTSAETFKEMWNKLTHDGYWQGELWDRRKTGQIYPKWVAISAIRDGNGDTAFYIASFTDITERKAAEARIEHLAHHDILTGLLNRFSLQDRLEQSLAFARRERYQVAVFFIDLDRFKTINDTLGHHIGDKLLVEVAGRLVKNLRESDIVARIGGDEFVIVLTGMIDSANVAAIAESLRESVSLPYRIDGTELETSPSIGISMYPDDGTTASELLKKADVAMYHAKDLGPGNYYFFTEAMLVAAKERAEIEHELRIALETHQFELHYQPKVRSEDNVISGFEALIRWRHPVHGLVPPDKFIPITEETGFIHSLGEWVLNEACRQLSEWRSKGYAIVPMAVNLSVKQLQSASLVELVSRIMKAHDIRRDELELEITETAAMHDPEFAVEQLTALRRLGVTLAIDDFGTGYSSLAYLKRLPIQTLKLDRTFVRDIEFNLNDAEICAATLALAHNLGLEVVAEGVETKNQQDFLLDHRCDYLQGYLFSRPVVAKEAETFLDKHIAAIHEALSENV